MTDVFVYGTLTDSARVDAVVDDYEFRGESVLEGLRRVDGRYPTLAPGGTTRGRVLRTPDVDALDAYEGVDAGLYDRVEVPYRSGDRSGASGDETRTGSRGASAADDATVAVYVGDPSRLGADATWPGDGSFEDRVRRYLRERDVFVRPAADERRHASES